MKRTDTSGWPCTIARSADILGDHWNLLIIRQACLGTRRFDDFQSALGIGRNILTQRLTRLVDEGLLDRVEYQQNPPRYEYRLTDKGRDAYPILAAMAAWGDRWLTGPGRHAPRAAPHRVRTRHARRRGLQRVRPTARRSPRPRQDRTRLPRAESRPVRLADGVGR